MRYILLRNLLHGFAQHPVNARHCVHWVDTIGLHEARSHETDKKQQDKNRVDSGASLTPFNDKGISKYGTTRRSNDATIADEYPLASSLEGGLGIQGQGRAIIQGATKADQQGTILYVLILLTSNHCRDEY